MRRFPNISLNFEEAQTVGNQLWAFGKVLHDEPKYAKPGNWILTYRYAIRAMMSRIMTVDRDYRNLNKPGWGLAPVEEKAPPEVKNKWNVIWESYAGVLFFAMDSSLECFTYALNALGYLISPCEFLDITTDQKLRWITPANLLEPPAKGKENRSAYGPCLRTFPKICAHWSANRDLVARIMEYHDATKHRHSVVVGQGFDLHLVKLEPKQAMDKVAFNAKGLVAYDEEQTLQSLTADYRTFMVEWLQVARQELEVVFEQPLPPLSS